MWNLIESLLEIEINYINRLSIINRLEQHRINYWYKTMLAIVNQ